MGPVFKIFEKANSNWPDEQQETCYIFISQVSIKTVLSRELVPLHRILLCLTWN